MEALSPAMLLQVWERCSGSHPIRRALALLECCSPAAFDWASAPVGERDARLLDFRESLFGPRLQTIVQCPGCGAELEANFAAGDIRAAPAAAPPQGLRLRAGDYAIEYRLPNSEDLLAVLCLEDANRAHAALLQRCVDSVQRRSRPEEVDRLPPEVVDLIERDMARHDPAADTRIALTCPGCGHAWSASFDVVSYLCDELEDWAQRTLVDVHLLARAYGWSEAEILALSPSRRRQYVEMVRA
jgi:hypothetical protein